MRPRHYDDWTVESWRFDSPSRPAEERDDQPPLRNDIVLATMIAVALWMALAILLL